jgi:predicted transcriptional regulator
VENTYPMKYRSSTEIIDSMLRSIRSGATKTHIMYRAYMSYSQLKEYLKLLEERELITYDPASQLYLLTEKGLKFMNAYDRINELVPSVNEGKSLGESKVEELPIAKKQEVFEY